MPFNLADLDSLVSIENVSKVNSMPWIKSHGRGSLRGQASQASEIADAAFLFALSDVGLKPSCHA
jgi:hypothetical protein